MSLVQDPSATVTEHAPSGGGGDDGAGAADPAKPRTGRARAALRELLLVVVLFLAYKAGRLVVHGHVDQAFHNGWALWDLERHLRLPSEVAVQQLLLGHRSLLRLVNTHYAVVHFPATVAGLVWLYVRRPAHYLWARRVLAWLTAAALALHMLMPVTPPRLLPTIDMVDTGRVYGPGVYGPPTADTLTNQYAAMPSLHVGWAVAVAVALIAATRGRWRWCWLLHPVVTLGVVVVTGNHYWLDALVAIALLTVALTLVPHPPAPARREDRAGAARVPA